MIRNRLKHKDVIALLTHISNSVQTAGLCDYGVFTWDLGARYGIFNFSCSIDLDVTDADGLSGLDYLEHSYSCYYTDNDDGAASLDIAKMEFDDGFNRFVETVKDRKHEGEMNLLDFVSAKRLSDILCVE